MGIPKKSKRDPPPPPPLPGVAVAITFVVVGGRGEGAWKNLEATEEEFEIPEGTEGTGGAARAMKEGVKGSAVALGDPGSVGIP